MTSPPVPDHVSSNAPTQLLDLPPELLHIIAEDLIATYHFRSLASLNVCNRFLYNVTLRSLWKELHLTEKTWKKAETDFLLTGKIPEGWKYVEYICFSRAMNETWFWTYLRTFHPSIECHIKLVHASFPAIKWIAESENDRRTGDPTFWLSSKNKDHDGGLDLLRNMLSSLDSPPSWTKLCKPHATYPAETTSAHASHATLESHVNIVPMPLLLGIRAILLKAPGAQTTGRQAESVGLFFHRLPEITLVRGDLGYVRIHMLYEEVFADAGRRGIEEMFMLIQQIGELRREEGNQTPMHLEVGCFDLDQLKTWVTVMSNIKPINCSGPPSFLRCTLQNSLDEDYTLSEFNTEVLKFQRVLEGLASNFQHALLRPSRMILDCEWDLDTPLRAIFDISTRETCAIIRIGRRMQCMSRWDTSSLYVNGHVASKAKEAEIVNVHEWFAPDARISYGAELL